MLRTLKTALAILLAAAAGTNAWQTPPLLDTWSELDARVGNTYESLTNGAIFPPYFTFDHSLGFYTFHADSELAGITNLLAADTLRGIPTWHLHVAETQADERVWIYSGGSATSGFRTNAVPASFDPNEWVRRAYGDPPDRLSGSRLANWYRERDRSRMHLSLTLILLDDWPSLVDAMRRASTNVPSPQDQPPTLPSDTNRIAFVWAGYPDSSDNLRLWLYSPCSTVPMDLFSRGALLPTNATWSLAATTPSSDTFSVWDLPRSASTAFFRAARADIDSDGDGIPDGRETFLYHTNPGKASSDDDGISDREELYRLGSAPNLTDSDGDGIPDNEDGAPTEPGPLITLTAPQDGAALAESAVFVAGTVIASNGLDSVWVQGIKVEAFALGDNTYGFTNTFLAADGTQSVWVRALSTNTPALDAQRSVTVTVDAQASDIAVLSPADSTVVTGACVHVEVWTEASNDVVTVNGLATERDGYMRYAWVTLVNLGSNTITAAAVDIQGRASSNSVTVVCTDLTYSDPADSDSDGVPDIDDPAPLNPSIKSTVVITYPPNGQPGTFK